MQRGMETDSCSHCAHGATPDAPRSAALRHALALEYLTVSWNLVEGVVAVAAAAAASSVALLGFGIDSFVECTSAAVMIWRLRAEHTRANATHIEQIERTAQKLVAGSLFLLAAYVCFDAATSLWRAEKPEFSTVGVVLTSVSLAVMLVLARAKRRAALALGSSALETDAFQTTACWWLSLATLAGVTLNGALGWWWADPVAAFVIAALVIKEGKEAWEGEHDCC